MKWLQKIKKWWEEQNDVEAIAAKYRPTITDEEMARQDEEICPQDTPGSIAVKNGETLYMIWEQSKALPAPSSPVAARIESHAQSDEYGMAEALRRLDALYGIVRDKNGEPMPGLTAVVQTNRGLMDGAAMAREIAASKRPSRGTEQVPVERVLREVSNARVPNGRHPKHARGKVLLPGQVGVNPAELCEETMLERHPGVLPPTNVE